MAKLRVGVLFGGRSGEHEVSLLSARTVIDGLNRAKYQIIPIGITLDGQWKSLPDEERASLDDILHRGQPVVLPPCPVRGRANPGFPKLDVIFPVLHGTFGEDGTVQGLLDLTGIPYVGAGVLASAAGMDKDIMKRLYRDAGLPVVPWALVKAGEWQAEPARVIRRIARHLHHPLFVKPANLGSSVGISKVHNRAELAAAIDLAARYDRRIVVEQGIDAREFECSVLGNDEARASLPGEVISGREFYDYAAKYLEEGSRTLIPAPLNATRIRTLQKLAVEAFHAIDCAGMARVDFFMDRASGAFYVNEINTIPGFTSISMYPKLWEATGLPLPDLLDQLIALALERQQKRMALQFRRME